jgi:hypothetical protein
MATPTVKQLLQELDREAKPGSANPRCQMIVNTIDMFEVELENTTNKQEQIALAVRIEALENQLIALGCVTRPSN